MTLRVLDPTPETEAPVGERATRLATLAGKRVGFVSNGKEGTKPFFAHLERLLKVEHGVAEVILRVKSNYSAPADLWIAEEMRRWDAVVAGIGD
jgi:hypothetical protein